MNNSIKDNKKIQEIVVDKQAEKVVINLPNPPEKKVHKEFYRIFGMTQPVLPEWIAPIPMSLPRALELVESRPWRVRVLRLLISHMETKVNKATLDIKSICDTPSKKAQFSAACKFLADSNIAIRLTQKNTKGTPVAYTKNTWLLNPKWAYFYENHEVNCIIWKSVTGREP